MITQTNYHCRYLRYSREIGSVYAASRFRFALAQSAYCLSIDGDRAGMKCLQSARPDIRLQQWCGVACDRTGSGPPQLQGPRNGARALARADGTRPVPRPDDANG